MKEIGKKLEQQILNVFSICTRICKLSAKKWHIILYEKVPDLENE